MADNIYLTELTKQKTKLATTLNNKGITASENEKFNTLVPKIKNINNLLGEEKTVDVLSQYNDTPKSIVSVEYPESFNMASNYKTTTHNGVTFTVNDDMSITVNGTNTSTSSAAYILCISHLLLEANNSYAWDLDIPDNENVIYTLGKVQTNIPAIGTYTPTKEITDSYLILAVPAGKTVNNVTVRQPIFYKRNNIDLQLSSKNLFDESILLAKTHTEDDEAYIFPNSVVVIKSDFKPNTQYTLTYTAKQEAASGSTTLGYPRLRFTYTDGTYIEKQLTTEYTTITLTSTAGKSISNLIWTYGTKGTFYLKKNSAILVEGTTPTSYTPYISDFSSVNVTACGKNLWFNESSYTLHAQFNSYYTGENFNDTKTLNLIQSLLYSGKQVQMSYDIDLTEFKKYGVEVTVWYKEKGATSNKTVNLYNLHNISKECTIVYMELRARSNSSEANGLTPTISNIQLEISNTPTTYEPYEGTTYASTADGIVTGIQNMYPLTNIFTDNAGVLITVKGGAYKEILPSTGKNGITKVYQEVVSPDMVENLKPENIKKGITILGITGTMK